MSNDRRLSKMAPTPGYSRYEDLMGSFETTTQMQGLLTDLRMMTTPSQIAFEPEMSVTVTTQEVTASEVNLTHVRSS